MNRHDLIAFEQHYAALLRREAKRRAKRYPAAAEQLERWARQADERITALRTGPLFDQDQNP